MAISISVSWSAPQRVLFRLLFSYFGLFMLSNQSIISQWIGLVWEAILPWIASNVLGTELSTAVVNSGSGDGWYNFLLLFWLFFLSVAITIVWTVLDRDRPSYRRLLQFFVVAVRYYLVFQMIIYGFAKLTYSQFPELGYYRLMQPIGDASPMGLLWSFMGYSYGYNLFTGGAEVLGGYLLLFRRTTTLGALVVLGVMSNVMALNFFYDVPVKLLSVHLVLLSMLLLGLDARRLFRVFLSNKGVQAVAMPDLFEQRWYVISKNIVKAGIIIAPVVLAIFLKQQRSVPGKTTAMEGLYEVEVVVENGDTLLHPDLARIYPFSYLAVEPNGLAVTKREGSHLEWQRVALDTLGQKLIFEGDSKLDTLMYSPTDSIRYWMQARIGADTLAWQMKRRRKSDFLLMRRGFHWTNENPYNR